MGTCFSYLKRNVKLERRQHSHYCLTPRSFYQRDTETVELQYLVSHVSNTVDTDPDANIYVADNDTLCGSEVADINENISCHSKRCSSNKKRKLIHRLLSWLEEKNDYSSSSVPTTEADLMLRMMLSNSNNKIATPHQEHNSASNFTDIDNNTNVYNNATSNINNGYNIQVNSSSSCHHNHVANSSHRYGTRSTIPNNFKGISCCSSKVPSNSNSNASSIDLEWEPEGNGVAVELINKTKLSMCQQQSSEDSVEVSLLSSAESLEWDSGEGTGVLDSDTEQLLQEIERLTARALKETGCDCEFECDNGNKSTVNDSYSNR